jgi:SAM-dependent methyltransferase
MPEPGNPIPAEKPPAVERSLEVDRPLPEAPVDPLFSSTPQRPKEAQSKAVKGRLARALKGRAFALVLVLVLAGVAAAAYAPAFVPGDPPVASLAILDAATVAASALHDPSHLLFSPAPFLGIPTLFTGVPLTVALIALAKGAFGLGFGWSARLLVALAAIALPLGTYRFVRLLLRKEFPALLAALLVGLPPFLLTFDPLVSDGFREFGLLPWPLLVILHGENGVQHVLGLALIPFALSSLLGAMRQPSYRRYLLSGLWIFAIALTSRLALVTWMVGSTVLLGSEIILGELGRKFRAYILAGLIGSGLAAVWYTPPFLAQTFAVGEGREILQGFVALVPLGFAVVPILATGLFLAFDRRPRLQLLLIGLLWSGAFTFVIVAETAFGRTFLPRPLEYVGEAWFGFTLVASWAVSLAVESLRRAFRFRMDERRANGLTTGLIVIVLGAAVSLNLYAGGAARRYIAPAEALQGTDAAAVAEALAEVTEPGERVYATGSTVRLLALGYRTLQVSGTNLFADANPNRAAAAEDVERGGDRGRAVSWLSALGVSHVAVPAPPDDPDRTVWPIAHPEMFAEAPFVLERTVGTTAIVRFPGALAVLVPATGLRDLGPFAEPPTDEQLAAYAALRAAGTPVAARFANGTTLEITGDIQPGTAVSIAVNAVPGWRLPGGSGTVRRDPMGFLAVEPTTSGTGTLTLRFGITPAWYVGPGVALLTLLVLLLARTRRVKRYAEAYRKLPPAKGILVAPAKVETFAGHAGPLPSRILELQDQAREHYREHPDVDWVEQTDNFAGIEEFFHKNRELITKKLIDKFGEGDRYLDAGCGTGLLLRHLPPGSVGLDINPQNIAKAREHAPNAALVVADIENIPFPSGMFTTVVCAEVLDRLPNPKQALAEIRRVLKPGGVIIGTVPRQNPMWRLRFLSSTLTPEPYRLEYGRGEAGKLLSPFRVELLAPALSYMTWAFVARKEEST